MKLVVLHGPAKTASRQKLSEIKQKFDPSSVVIFEKGTDPGVVLANLQTVSMFSEDRLIIWENPPDDFNIDYSLIHLPSTLTLWFDHEVKTKYPGEVHFFPEAKEISVFPFLDFLGSKDKRAFLELDKLKKAGYDNQYFITMIFYLLRNLVATPKGAHQFVKSKNEKFRKNFSGDELVKLYRDVLEIDFKIKKGLLEETQAEFLLVDRFIQETLDKAL